MQSSLPQQSSGRSRRPRDRRHPREGGDPGARSTRRDVPSGPSFCPCFCSITSQAGSRPGGRVTSFVSPKEVTKRRRPHCPRPLRACGATGQPPVLAPGGEALKLGPAGLRQSRFLIRPPLRSSARPQGIGGQHGLRPCPCGLGVGALSLLLRAARWHAHISWIPAFAGMTEFTSVASFPRRRESRPRPSKAIARRSSEASRFSIRSMP